MNENGKTDDLLEIMARLRDPEAGCPWDLKQTFETILPYTLEEAYEVAEAIEEQDMPALCDELGDLLLQVVFHARMAEEQGHFAFAHVVEAICAKMIRRHPHVFDATSQCDEADLRANWERAKAAERAEKGLEAGQTSLLDGVALALPALARAEKLQRRAARVGFDWEEIEGVLEKVREELDECHAVFSSEADHTHRVHEIGDLLFSCVNLARHLGVDAEQALRAANQRFQRRFEQIERGLQARGKEPGPAVREEMERLWEAAKEAGY